MNGKSAQALLGQELDNILEKLSGKRFARACGINPTALYKIRTGSRKIRKKSAVKYFKPFIPEKKWKEIETRFDFEEEKHFDDSSNLTLAGEIPIFSGTYEEPILTKDQFELHRDYFYSAAITMFELEDFTPSPLWFAERLGVSIEKSREMLTRLFRLKLIGKKNGKYFDLGRRFHMTWPETVDVTWNRMKQIQKLILDSISVGRGKKLNKDITFTFNPEDMPKLRDLTAKYLEKVERLSRTSQGREIYAVFLSVVPITKENDSALSKNS